MMKHDLGIVAERRIKGVHVVEVDTAKIKHFGIPWRDLGSYGRRKIENLIVLRTPHERTEVHYL